MPTDVFVGLGSNIEPERHLRDALESLRNRLTLVEESPVYRNPAVGFMGDDFLNMVVRLRCTAGPAELEGVFSEIEQAGGRRRRRRARAGRQVRATGADPIGPRTLDLDLLLYGSAVDPELGLPRSDVLRYAFVLRPLADLAPDLVHPISGRPLLVEWEAMADRSPRMERQQLLMSR